MNAQLAQHAKCRVDGKSVPAASFYLPPTNYGQPSGFQRFPYEIEIPLPAFLEATESKFDQFAHEMRADEAKDPTHDGFPELTEFQKLGYPNIRATLSSAPRLLETLLLNWLELSVLEQFSTRGPSPGYAFETLDAVAMSTDAVRLRGHVVLVP